MGPQARTPEAPDWGLRHRRFEHPLRLRHAVALGEVDAQAGQHLDDLGVLGKLGDGLLAGEVADLIDGADHLPVDRVAQDLAHEAAVDLEVVDREVLQVPERGEAGAEVIERELAAELLQRLDEAVGLREAGNGRGLGDLEADLRAVEPAAVELIDDERQELVIPQALAGEIDRAERQLLALVRLRYQPAEGVLDHPPIDRRRDAIALRGRDEVIRRNDTAVLILQAKQQLVVRAEVDPLQGLDGHAVDLETAFLQCGVDTRGPLHLAAAPHQLHVVLSEAVNAIAAAFLRCGTGAVCSRKNRGYVLVVRRDRDDADARAQAEYAVFPGEAEVADALAQRLGRSHRIIERAG